MTVKDAVFSGSREQVISEDAFRDILAEAAEGLFGLRHQVERGFGREWSRHFVSRLIREVHSVRTVLNDHDAQENRTYSSFMEIVAGIRGFSHVLYILKHLRERYMRSPLRNVRPEGDRFLEKTMQTLAWCGDTLRGLFTSLIDECGNLGLELPDGEPAGLGDPGVGPEIRRHLPHNIDEEDLAEEGEKVAQVASSFLRFGEMYRALEPKDLESYGDLREYVRGKLDEEHARTLESWIHSIQSKYDTYVQFTTSEVKDPELRALRSAISQILHLLEVTTHLVHFYERHENDIRSRKAKERIARIVDKKTVLDRAVNYAFRNVGWLMEEAERICQRLIPDYTSIEEVTFRIPEGVRLHIRPAALIAAIVAQHGTPVVMRMNESECDASSVTDVIFLAGTNLEAADVTFRGDERPLADLATLFRLGLEDSGREELEVALPYLNRRR